MSKDKYNVLLLCESHGLLVPTMEHRFHATRKWRFDYAWVDQKVAMEVEGILFSGLGGRHQRGAGYEGDMIKYLEAQKLGWQVIRVSPKMAKAGDWIELIKRRMSND